MGDQRLLPSERLRHPSEFRHVLCHGKKLVTPIFILYVLPTSAPRSRLGIAVSKRVGNAVIRNRVKRVIRELFRHHKAALQPTCDVVFVARRHATEASLEDCVQQFLALPCCRQPPEKEDLTERQE